MKVERIERVDLRGSLMRAVKVFVLVIGIMGLSAGGAQAAETLYELSPGTTFQEGCVGPCLCPITLPEEMTGR